MITRSDLESLLYALRGAGLRAGVEETLAMEFLLGRLTEDPAPLRLALRALVPKSTEQLAAFDHLFARWESALRQREQTTKEQDGASDSNPLRLAPSDSYRPPQTTRPEPRSDIQRKPASRRWMIGMLVLLLGFGMETAGLLHWLFLPRPLTPLGLMQPVAPPDPVPQPTPNLPPPTPNLPPPTPPKQREKRWIPAVTVLPKQMPRTLWYGIGWLGLWGGLLCLAYVQNRRKQARKVMATSGSSLRAGAARVFLDASRTGQREWTRLLDRKTEEALVWGIDKYLSTEPTRRVDVRKTVEASARSMPLSVLHFQQARHQREVWLWLDESMQVLEPAAWSHCQRLLDEMEQALRKNGLPVERAVFYGIPDELTLQDARGRAVGRVRPSDLDDRMGQALTAIVTGGTLLQRQLESEDQRQKVRGLLRTLSHHPGVCFVEAVAGTGLAERLRKYELPVIPPGELPTFLGGEKERRRRLGERPSEVLAWAAACALPSEPVSESLALWLHKELALPLRPEALLQVRAMSGCRSGPLRFACKDRARLWAAQLGPLSRYEGDIDKLAERVRRALLGKTLRLLRQRIEEEQAERSRRDAEVPFVGTEGAAHLRLQRALLDLWDRPHEATQALTELSQGPMADEVRRRLADYVPAEREGAEDQIVLPWRFSDAGEAASKLLALGLGGTSLAEAALTLRPAGTKLLGLGGAVGVMLAAVVLLTIGARELRSPHGEPHIRQENAPQAAQVEVKQQSETEYLVTARNGAEQASERVPAGSEVLVSWVKEEREPEDGGTETPKDLGADLASPPDLSHAEDLAEVEDLTKPRPDLAKPNKPRPDLAKPEPAAQPPPVVEVRMPTVIGGGSTTAGIKASGVTLEAKPGEEWCPYEEKTIQGVVFVKVCGGDFVMGSADEDREAESDEKPAHPVHVDTFWIGKYEVSNEQYRKKEPGHKGRYDGAELPVESVTWGEARAYCQSLGGDLPTEAEWEYAARGPEGRKYPWGKAAPDKGRATFGQDWDNGQPDNITANAKGRGPFGTLNQAGNVWEWCLDWYDDYKVTKDKDKIVKLVNPIGPPSGSWRVLRGGSFSFGPRFLRSAVRGWDGPEDRNGGLGFRCVRDSGRQR